MKIALTSIMVFALMSPMAVAEQQEEVESYLVAPYTLNKNVTVTTTDGKKVEGKVLRGDDDKIVVQQGSSSIELPTSQIASLRTRRAKRSAKLDFAGNLIGGVGLGFAGAAVGKKAGENIRGDGTSGKAGPIVGGIAFGFAGGYLGRYIVRHSASEMVTLKVAQGGAGQPAASAAPAH